MQKQQCTASVVVDISVMVSCNKKSNAHTATQPLIFYPSERRVMHLIGSDVT